MPRRALAAVLLVALAAPAFAQRDKVVFRDRATNKEDTAEGDAAETPGGVKMTFAGKDRFIPATDILRVEFAAVDTATRVNSSQAEGKGPAEAMKFYADALAATPATAPERLRRYLAYREVQWHTVLAIGKDDKEFPAEAKKAAAKLTAFVKANPKTWEQWPLGRAAARLNAELKDWTAADDLLAGLGAIADAPADARLDVKLVRVGYLVRAGKYAEATTVLAEVEGDAALVGPLKERAAIYKEALAVLPPKDTADPDPLDPQQKKKVNPADAVAKITKLADGSKDPGVRAVGYGVLGEVQLAHRQFRQATWSFLWVDTLYTQDADERLFACLRLAEVFAITGDKDGDKNRSEQFRERLPKVR